MSAAGGGDGGAASEPAADNTAIWVEASSGMKRGKIYGWGNLSREFVANDGGSSSSNASASKKRRVNEEMAQLVSRLKLLLAEMDKQMKRQEERMSQQDDQIRSLQAQMQMVLQTLNINPAQVPPVSPTNQIGHGRNNERRNDDDIDDEEILHDIIG